MFGSVGDSLRENRLALFTFENMGNGWVRVCQALVSYADVSYTLERHEKLGGGMATRFRLAEELGDQMTQVELAQRAGLSFATVNRLCTNHTAQVSLESLDRISTVLGVEPGDLIERTKRKRKR